MEKISAVYKITNTVTSDFYIGSSKNVKLRWAVHKCPSTWKRYPNNPMYKDMQKYGVDKFRFEILGTVEPGYLKKVEQGLIEVFQPTYNQMNAKGKNIEKFKKCQKSINNLTKEKKLIGKPIKNTVANIASTTTRH
jgi:group I intron endonuclease